MPIIPVPQSEYAALKSSLNKGDDDEETIDEILNAGVDDSTLAIVVLARAGDKLLGIRMTEDRIDTRIVNPDEVDPEGESIDADPESAEGNI